MCLSLSFSSFSFCKTETQATISIHVFTQHHPGIRRWRSGHPLMFRRAKISPSVVTPWAFLHLLWSSGSWIAIQSSTLSMASFSWSTSLQTILACIRSTSPTTWATRRRFFLLMWRVSETIKKIDKRYQKTSQCLNVLFFFCITEKRFESPSWNDFDFVTLAVCLGAASALLGMVVYLWKDSKKGSYDLTKCNPDTV